MQLTVSYFLLLACKEKLEVKIIFNGRMHDPHRL